MENTIEILIVDDEPHNLLSFQATFRKEFQIHTATSALEAYQQLAEHPHIQIIIVDQQMPDLSGTALLEELKVIYPLPIRILLTGYPTLQVVLESINKGNVYKFVHKPWQEEEMRNILYEASTEYQKRNALTLKYQSLQTTYANLEKFARIISHDIKSPLHGIYSMVWLSEKISDKDEQATINNILKETTQTLNTYISHLRDYYETKDASPNLEEVDIDVLINQVYSIHLAEIHISNIQVVIKNDITVPIFTDRHLVFIILNNMISNAIRFQKPENLAKAINISTALENGTLSFYVQDNGVGIPEDQQARIFDLFFRSDHSKNSSGFGLYNAKQAARQLGGDLFLQQSSPAGSIFVLSIPTRT